MLDSGCLLCDSVLVLLGIRILSADDTGKRLCSDRGNDLRLCAGNEILSVTIKMEVIV